MMVQDVARWRSDTPACRDLTHFNNAGSSLPPSQVVDAVVQHLRLEAQIGGYEAAAKMAPTIDRVRPSIAAMLGATPIDIALVENATRAWDMAFYSIPFEPGDMIITGIASYVSNYLAFLHIKELHRVEIVVCPDDEYGQIDVLALESLCTPKTKLIALTHAPTNGGLVNPAAEVGKIAKNKGILYLLDACQSVGQMPLDVAELGCDFLSATGRKFLRAPRGTGFLYANSETTGNLHPPFVDLRAAEWTNNDSYVLASGATRFENWETYVGGQIGLGVAVDYALAIGLDTIQVQISELASSMRLGLGSIPGITVRDKGAQLSGIVTFTHTSVSADRIQTELSKASINTSVSRTGSTRLDFAGRDINELVRASLHYYNTTDEIDRFLSVLTRIIG